MIPIPYFRDILRQIDTLQGQDEQLSRAIRSLYKKYPNADEQDQKHLSLLSFTPRSDYHGKRSRSSTSPIDCFFEHTWPA